MLKKIDDKSLSIRGDRFFADSMIRTDMIRIDTTTNRYVRYVISYMNRFSINLNLY